jgi:hypothetical protein
MSSALDIQFVFDDECLMMIISCLVALLPQLTHNQSSNTALLKVQARHLRFGVQTSWVSIPFAPGTLQAPALQVEIQLVDA